MISDLIRSARTTILNSRKRTISTSGNNSFLTCLDYVQGQNQQDSNGNPIATDPYDGNLTYIQDGGAVTVVPNPVGVIDLSALAPDVTEIHCHNCPGITSLNCSGDALLTVLDLEDLPAITSLVFNGCTALTSVNLDTFTNISVNVNFLNCSSLASVSATNLTNAGFLYFTGCALVNASFPSLVSATEISLGYMPTLLSISFPSLQSATTYIFFSNNSSLVSVSVPLLETTGILYVNDCASIPSLSFPSLTTVNDLLLYNLDVITSIDVPLLEDVPGSIGILSSPFLNSFDMPSYTAILPPTIDASGCSSLQTFTAGTMLAFDGGTYTFTDCSLIESSVNGLIQSLTDAGTTATTLDMSGGTSSPPDATHIAQAGVLNGVGNFVSFNP